MTKSRFNPKGKPTKAALEFMAIVKQQPCCKCHTSPVDCHHITECGRRLGNFYCLPLCKRCHAAINDFQDQMRLCREMYTKLGMIFTEPTTKIVRKI